MISFTQASSDDELRQILLLQRANLPETISEEERKQEGFVTVTHDFSLLRKMNLRWPHTIAKDRDKVVGYALSMHPDFANEIDVLQPMFEEIKQALKESSFYDLTGKNYLVMGQVCIDKAYRSKGIFRKLYKTMAENASTEFDCIITEVDQTNTRSLQAHYRIGFLQLNQYSSGNKNWELIYLPC